MHLAVPHRIVACGSMGAWFWGRVRALCLCKGEIELGRQFRCLFGAFAKAVTDQGLSVDEYIEILEVAQNDPDVGEQIRQRLLPSAR